MQSDTQWKEKTGKRKTLPYRMPVINVKGMTELESHHFVRPNVKSNLSKNHQCTLKPLGERFFRNKTHLMSKYYPTDYLAMQRGKCVFKMKRSGCHLLIKLGITKNWKIT